MFDYLQPGETILHRFVQQFRDGLLSAAYVLGGAEWFRRAATFIDEVQSVCQITLRIRRQAFELLGLFCLENADVAGSVEAHHFAMIDPASPVVEEICLLTDRFADCLAEMWGGEADCSEEGE